MKRFLTIFLVFSIVTTLLCVSGFCVKEASASASDSACSQDQNHKNAGHILSCDVSNSISKTVFKDDIILKAPSQTIIAINYIILLNIDIPKKIDSVKAYYPPPQLGSSVKSLNNTKILTTGRIRI